MSTAPYIIQKLFICNIMDSCSGVVFIIIVEHYSGLFYLILNIDRDEGINDQQR